MIDIKISKFNLAQMFGLQFVDSDFEDECSSIVLYEYEMHTHRFVRDNGGWLSCEEMHERMAEEVLDMIGKSAAMRIT